MRFLGEGAAVPTERMSTPFSPGDGPQIANRLARVFKHRRKWARRTGVTCFRIYDHDIPDQPFVCDWYDGEAVVWTRTRTRNETEEHQDAWIALVRSAVATGLGLTEAQIHLKERRRQSGRQKAEKDADDGQYQKLEGRGVTRLVTEQGLTFEVNLDDYLDTGLFLDHRPTRNLIRALSPGKRVLNLFAYTGSFTCYAGVGGAARTMTVDLSNTYLAWAARNLAHNGLADGPHDYERADCLKWLAGAPHGRFDLIVCDPPTFSNSTAMDRSWSVERDHPWLLERLFAWLAPGGSAFFSTNCHGFKLTTDLPDFAAVEDLTAVTTPEDFAGQTPHHCWRLERPR